MKKITLFFICLFCVAAFLNAQNTEIKTFFEGHFVGGLADDGETIWVGVDNLLVNMDKISGETLFSSTIPISNEYPEPDRHVSSISLDNNGQLWILCWGQVSYLESFSEVKNWVEIPLPSVWCSGLIVDKNNKVWVTTMLGLHKYDGTGWVDYNSLNTELPNSAISAIAVDNQNNKWFSLSFDPLYGPTNLVKYDDQQFTIYPDVINNIIWSIDVSPNGTVWMAKWLGGLIKFDGTNWEVFNPTIPGLPVNSFQNVTVENETVIWLSPANESGLIRFDGENWDVFNIDNSHLPSNTINSILIDEKGTKWVGTDKGLISFPGSALSIYDVQNSGDELRLFPNPANDFITLKTPVDVADSNVKIFNILGKTMKSLKMTHSNYKIDISDLPVGLYFLRLETKNGVTTKKFVKQNL